MKKSEIICSLIWVALGTSQCIEAVRLRLGNLHRPGPGFLPFISGILLGVFGLILMFSSVSKVTGGDGESNGRKMWVKGNSKRLLLTLFALFAYALSFETLGFLIATFLFLFFLFKLTEPKRWVGPLVFSGMTVVLSYLIFCVWLKSTFPAGILIRLLH